MAYEPIRPRDIFERDGWQCKLCEEPIDRAAAYPAPLSPTLDHIVPLAKGGAHALHLQLAQGLTEEGGYGGSRLETAPSRQPSFPRYTNTVFDETKAAN